MLLSPKAEIVGSSATILHCACFSTGEQLVLSGFYTGYHRENSFDCQGERMLKNKKRLTNAGEPFCMKKVQKGLRT